jgi:glycogen synthase
LVLNDIPALRELWGNAALYFQTNDAQSLADTVRLFADDAQLRRNFANRAFQRARESYNSHRMTDNYVQLYHSIVTKKAAAA